MATATASLETTKSRIWTKPRVSLLGLLIVLLTAFQSFISNYQPLVWGNTGASPLDARITETLGGYPEPESLAEVTLEPGKPVSFAFSIVNEGPLPITIEGILHPSVIGLDVQGIEITPVDYEGDPNASTAPFSETTIGPGEQRVVRVNYVTGADCSKLESGSTSWADSIPVTYSTLWSTQTTEFPLPLRLIVKGSVACRV